MVNQEQPEQWDDYSTELEEPLIEGDPPKTASDYYQPTSHATPWSAPTMVNRLPDPSAPPQ